MLRSPRTPVWPMLLAVAACTPPDRTTGPDLPASPGRGPALTTQYNLVRIPAPPVANPLMIPWSGWEARAMNAQGLVIGRAWTSTWSQSFTYAGAGSTLLKDPANQTNPYLATWAQDVNANGWIVGCVRYNGLIRPALWTSPTATPMVLSPPPPFTNSEGCFFGINDQGTVVGALAKADTVVAIRWSLLGGLQNLHPANWRSSLAQDINNAGEIAGVAYTQHPGYVWLDPPRQNGLPVRWTAAGSYTFATLTKGELTAISGTGTAVGWYMPAGSQSQAIQHTSAGNIVNLTANPAIAEVATGVSSKDRVIGIGPSAWTRYPATAPAQVLTASGLANLDLRDVNSCGSIVGSGAGGTGVRALLWIPRYCD